MNSKRFPVHNIEFHFHNRILILVLKYLDHVLYTRLTHHLGIATLVVVVVTGAYRSSDRTLGERGAL